MKKLFIIVVLLILAVTLVAQNDSREFLLDLGLGAGFNVHKVDGRNLTEESALGRRDGFDGVMGVDFGVRLGYRNWQAPVYFTAEFGTFRHGLNRSFTGGEIDIVYFQRYVAPGVLVSLFGGLQLAASTGFSVGEARTTFTTKVTGMPEVKSHSSNFLSSGDNFNFNAYSLSAAWEFEIAHNQGIVAGVRHFSAINESVVEVDDGWDFYIESSIITTRATNLFVNYRFRF